MIDLRKVSLVPYDPSLVTNRFDCGRVGLNRYLKNRARKTHERNEHRVFLASIDESDLCIGYYALSIGTDLVSDVMKQFQEYVSDRAAFSAVHLEYLAVDDRFQKQGLGRFMLVDAFRRVIEIAGHAGFYALTLQSLDNESTAFYERIGFRIYLDGDNPKMFYPLGGLLQLPESV